MGPFERQFHIAQPSGQKCSLADLPTASRHRWKAIGAFRIRIRYVVRNTLALKQAQLKRIIAMDEFAAQPSISGASNHCHFILQTLRRQTDPNGSV
jgi:hypothetical protein